MARCIVFDRQTAQTIATDLHLLAVCDSEADPLQSALHSRASASLLVLPTGSPDQVLVARFQRNRGPSAPTELPAADPIGFEATGFLGLTDQPVYDPCPTPARKWWQKIFD